MPHQLQHINRSRLWTGVKIALAVVLIGVVLSQTSLSEMRALWHRISPWWLLGSVTTFYAIIWLMAKRYWLLIGKKTTFRELLGLVVIQTVVSNLVASAAGVASYVAVLRGKHHIHIGQSVVSLVLARLGDLLVLFVALVVSSWMVWSRIAVLHWVVGVAASMLGSIVICTLLLLVFRSKCSRLFLWTIKTLHLDRAIFMKRITGFISAIEDVGTKGIWSNVQSFLSYSLLIFMYNILFSFCGTRLFSIDIDIWSIVFMSSVSLVMTLIPIQVFGGLGTNDITSVYLYTLFGIDQAQAIPFIVGSRLVFYAINVATLFHSVAGKYLGYTFSRFSSYER